ncbi:MAG: NAD-dependent epimerase/dehydratase family protein [Defluviitaleaceae bacterium]|nr:NAD-dependent epimerase/dehydratase family protein [Defluviitaleaceae bacterium]MCL2263793.1 NAD-dependent epimerase/dehydratase family protein [Defluviitaleaceae bacterium]
MKILIVGSSGYIGKKFAEYAAQHFAVHAVDSREGWKTHDFENYSAVIFAAGIAHRRQTKENAHLYFAVNRDLAVAVAQKAKTAKVPQFVYLSSMAVFGKKEGEISAHTKPKPPHNNHYGTSKLHAENALINLQSTDFKIAIIRPPMVYGENCPGKYGQLVKMARYMPLVPCNKNKRSVIYIDNLSQFLCAVISNGAAGVFHPQNTEHVSTAQLITQIRRENGKQTVTFGAEWLLHLCKAVFPPFKTAFGNLYYEKDIDEPH